jgi:diaminohydroxyphosphoribosylaminopyrimidine deaminase / 5-amino-6-(5-phosphoribosylamino)uracil reductase
LYVTLEPCSHFGKTPPCADLLVRHRPKRVVVAMQDPYPEVAGCGIKVLQDHGIEVQIGVLESQARALNAPYLKLLETGKPWVIAKWAMTLDGAIATQTGDSKWISNELSRAVVHELRGRMDAVIVGIGTVLADDPFLTTRLSVGMEPHRIATRIVLDRSCRCSPQSKLVQSIDQGPVLIACSENADPGNMSRLRELGCEVLPIPESMLHRSLEFLLIELGKRRCTNVLIEGGGELLGHAFDCGEIDEVHCFIAPKIAGGSNALRPIGGKGHLLMQHASALDDVQVTNLLGDTLVQGKVQK